MDGPFFYELCGLIVIRKAKDNAAPSVIMEGDEGEEDDEEDNTAIDTMLDDDSFEVRTLCCPI